MRDAHLFEEKITHVRVKVLSRVHDGFTDIGMFADFPADNGGFYELWSCPDDGNDFHKLNSIG